MPEARFQPADSGELPSSSAAIGKFGKISSSLGWVAPVFVYRFHTVNLMSIAFRLKVRYSSVCDAKVGSVRGGTVVESKCSGANLKRRGSATMPRGRRT